MTADNSILALDIGEARVGVAVANSVARLPNPLAILANDSTVFERIKGLIKEHNVGVVIVGLPRNMQGEETKQSEFSRSFADKLKTLSDKPVVFVDESLSSKRAEEYKSAQNRNSKYLDDIAACFILEEYLGSDN